MKLELAFFAKALELGDNGTFSVLVGGLNGLDITRTPFTLPSLSLLLRFVAESNDDVGSHDLRVEMYGSDGEKYPSELTTTFVLGRKEKELDPFPSSTLLLVFPNLEFRRAGKHEFRVSVKNQFIGALPLFVRACGG